MTNQTKIQVGIVGGSGFTAGELIRILLYHPHVEIRFVTSQSFFGKAITEVHKDLIGETDLTFVETIEPIDVLFLCLPHGESIKWLEKHKNQLSDSVKIIDLGNDLRVDTVWGNKRFVYGLSEINKEAIQQANYIANPGCFATAIQLGILPIVQIEKIENVHVVGVTGSTGAGKSLIPTTNFSWRSGNISAYKTLAHQHIAEINKTIQQEGNQTTSIQFVPWRGDFTRGIFASLMFISSLSLDELYAHFKSVYAESPFVFVSETEIDLKWVVNTNKALIQIEKVGVNVAVHVAIDNLLKGASGQAVQNMNLMFGWNEKAGLNLKPVVF